MNFNQSAFTTFQPEKTADLNAITFSESEMTREKELFDYYTQLKGDDAWSSVREVFGKFSLKTAEYSFGKRMYYNPDDKQNYVDLQSSRNIEISDDGFSRSLEIVAEKSSELNEADHIRIKEIDAILEKIRLTFIDMVEKVSNPEDVSALKSAFVERNKERVAHIHPRSFNILNYYSEKENSECKGYTFCELTSLLLEKSGFSSSMLDMTANCSADFSGIDLILGYHSLECSPDPVSLLEKISKSADSGTKVHFEVTIEPGVPRIRYGHLFPFEKGDLQQMLKSTGYIPVSYSNIPHPGGPQVERVLAVVR